MSERVIHKYRVEATMQMPRGAKVLSCQPQGGDLMLWAIVDPAAQFVERQTVVRGTGWDLGIPDNSEHLITEQDGRFVWHRFLLPEAPDARA